MEQSKLVGCGGFEEDCAVAVPDRKVSFINCIILSAAPMESCLCVWARSRSMRGRRMR